ncbi:MAG TPA: SGNH/GDSL hydrolase family protein [Gemmatimonadaceae bacterium]|nr:SGNH/GDSL hydrolase family protein [Gemmatimonadaceae bacterium]
MHPGPPPVPPAEVRILALGDSYTIGESVSAEERWPVQLAKMLRARGIAVADPQIVARTGWTTDELSAGIDDAKPKGPYDVVTLLIGVNNQYRGRSIDEYRAQFRALLARAIEFAGGRASRVIVVSIPDWGVAPFAAGRDAGRIATEIDAFNRANREEAERKGAAYVDVTAVSRRAQADRGLVAGDGLHPSGAMYAEWTKLILPTVLAAL